MAIFEPPPTWAEPVIVDEKTGKSRFNPIWLKWFVDLVAVVNAAGGGGGSLQHNSLAGLQGGQANQFYHLTLAQLNALVTQATGTWTPADNSGAGLSFSAVSANYTQVGNMVFAYAAFTYPVTANGANASISGLPVGVPNQNYAQTPSPAMPSVLIANGLVLQPVKNTSTANFKVDGSGAAVTNAQLSTAAVVVLLIYPAA